MKKQSFIYSLRDAFLGIAHCVVFERNIQINIAAALLAGFLAWWVKLEKLELLILILTSVCVLVAEMFNTAIEAVVDLISPEFHPIARIAKHIAAGAVLLTALASLVVGYILFFPKLFG